MLLGNNKILPYIFYLPSSWLSTRGRIHPHQVANTVKQKIFILASTANSESPISLTPNMSLDCWRKLQRNT